MSFKLQRRRAQAFPDRRFLGVILLACAVPLLGVAGFRALDRDRTAPVLSAPAAVPAAAPPNVPRFIEFTDVFRKNETVTSALMRHGLTQAQVQDLVRETRPLFALNKVVAGREFKGNHSPNGDFHEFRYRIDDARYLTVYRDGDTFVPLVKEFLYETRTELVSASIVNSLFGAVAAAGEQDRLATELSEIFTWDVDFYSDIQKGDSFQLLLEKKYLDGRFVRYGAILAADLVVQNKRLSAYRYQNEYYDGEGKALRKSFLKSPLRFTRISSRFTLARMHPILRIVRPHLGVDYAAPEGTPVVAVAAGRVISAGFDGGFGKSVRIRHSDGYESVYSHLSHIAVRGGMRVAQSDPIGSVGSTGLATGPHLDFRLLKRGKYRNPAKEIFPPAAPVPNNHFIVFARLRDDLRNRLDPVSPGGAGIAYVSRNPSAGGKSSK